MSVKSNKNGVLAPGWQHPYVNIFKLCEVEGVADVEHEGDVTEHMDRIIGKPVYKVRGTIPAGNYMRLPKARSQVLGLTGRYLYMQVKVTPVKVFVIHVEVMTADQNMHRISISNMYTADTLKRRSHGVQIPFPSPSHRWCVMALDMQAALQSFSVSPFLHLRAVQLCSWMTVRSLYTSSTLFSLESLPRDMALSHAMDTSIFEFALLPAEPPDARRERDSGSNRKVSTSHSPQPSQPQRSASPDTAAVTTLTSNNSVSTMVKPPAVRSSATRASTGRRSSLKPPTAATTTTTTTLTATAATTTTSPHQTTTATFTSQVVRSSTPGAPSATDQILSTTLAEGMKGSSPSAPRTSLAGGPSPPSGIFLAPSVPPSAAAPSGTDASRSTHQTGSAGQSDSVAAAMQQQLLLAGGKHPTDPLAASSATAATIAKVSRGANPPLISDRSSAALPAPIAALALASKEYASAVRKGQEPGHGNSAAMGPLLLPDSALTLLRINGYSGEFVRLLRWAPLSGELVFAAAGVVVAMKADVSSSGAGGAYDEHTQRFFQGHTSHVVALALDTQGRLLASAQEGKQALVRLWDFATGQCLTILNGHASGLSCVDISPDSRALLAVGLDSAAKQTLMLWSIVDVHDGGKTSVLVKHATEFNIKCARFSAYEEDHLVTVGRDSIRMYRLKAGQLRGVSVRLASPDKRVTSTGGGAAVLLGPNIFTDIAFQGGAGVYGSEPQCFFVAAASGALFQVSYIKRELEAVYQLHSAAINSLAVLDGLVITGGDDRMLRVWPTDFKEHLLEAEHEASVTSVALSNDGLRVAIGTENGTIGVLDVPSHTYSTLLRSHCGNVLAVAADPNRNEYVTVSSDGTIRVWDTSSHTQLYEFDAPGEVATCVVVHPLHREVAVGFANGRLRVFDIGSTTLVQEQHQHKAAVSQLLYTPDGARLLSGGCDGGLVVYDVAQVYAPIKFLFSGLKDLKVCMAVSGDGLYVATLAHDTFTHITSLLIFHTDTLEPFMRIQTDVASYIRLAFSTDSQHLWALSDSCRLDRFVLRVGKIVQQVEGVHRLGATALVMDPAGTFAATAGLDHLVRMWSQHESEHILASSTSMEASGHNGWLAGAPANQAFVGHSAAVTDVAFVGHNHLVSVGEADSIYLWRVHRPDPPSSQNPRELKSTVPPSMHTPSKPGLPSPSYVAKPGNLNGTLNSGRMNDSISQADISMRSWLSPRQPPAGQGTVHADDSPSYNDGGRADAASSSVPVQCSSLIGFTPTPGASNLVWRPLTGLFAYTAGPHVVIEDLATRQQRYLSASTQTLTTLTASADGHYVAAAALCPDVSSLSRGQPAGAADVCVWEVASGTLIARLQYHPTTVQALSFSPDGRWLLSLGREPETSLVVWDLSTSTLVAVGRLQEPGQAVAWLGQHNGLQRQQQQQQQEPPRFVSAGQEGLLLWTLYDSFLEQRALPLNTEALGSHSSTAACTAVAVSPSDNIYAADASGSIWCVQLQPASGGATIQTVVHLHGERITCLEVADNAAMAATYSGRVVSYRCPVNTPWVALHTVTLDGPIFSLQPAGGSMTEATAATATATIWYVPLTDAASIDAASGNNRHDSLMQSDSQNIDSSRLENVAPTPLVSAHAARVRSLCGCSSRPGVVASADEAGVLHVWSLVGAVVEPLAEFSISDSACTTAAFLPGGQQLVGGFANGSLSLFDISDASVTEGAVVTRAGSGDGSGVVWTIARHTAPVVGMVAHPKQPLLLTASSDGAVAVTDTRTARMITYCTGWSGGRAEAGQRLEAVAVSHPAATLTAVAWRGGLQVFPSPWTDSTCRITASYTCAESAGALSHDVPACVAFVHGSLRLVAYSSGLLLGQVLLYDTRMACVASTINLPEMVCSLSISHDGATLAAGSTQGHLLLASLDSNQHTATLLGHTGSVTSVCHCSTKGGGYGDEQAMSSEMQHGRNHHNQHRVVSAAGTCLMVWEVGVGKVDPPPPPLKIL